MATETPPCILMDQRGTKIYYQELGLVTQIHRR